MITKAVIQTCLDNLKELTKVDFCVIDVEGMLMAGTLPGRLTEESVLGDFLHSSADSQMIGDDYLFKIRDDKEVTHILTSRGGQADGYIFGKIAVSQIQQLIEAYKEQYDHTNFMQNLLMDNLLPKIQISKEKIPTDLTDLFDFKWCLRKCFCHGCGKRTVEAGARTHCPIRVA